MSGQYNVMVDIIEERERQDTKWGVQTHNDHLWNTILSEEVGEVSKALLDHEFKGKPVRDIRAELVQVAAVAVSWLECIDRRASL
jgi:NTP pyrophosphatase (non-canonical NTP hydrolase)